MYLLYEGGIVMARMLARVRTPQEPPEADANAG
jgi:Sec-independent protein secretion pathway component TatC